ncbi:hypothetical protein EPYR_02183 [Erwinia pyrifoliae DSM 12163]|nr:hypothetical protein EJP617_26960 [Erwinia sp. Ejp617]CAY74563.1 hypothetical protein EPYR_02183 [Erwinia pyrifoliae DSM 12163]
MPCFHPEKKVVNVRAIEIYLKKTKANNTTEFNNFKRG